MSRARRFTAQQALDQLLGGSSTEESDASTSDSSSDDDVSSDEEVSAAAGAQASRGGIRARGRGVRGRGFSGGVAPRHNEDASDPWTPMLEENIKRMKNVRFTHRSGPNDRLNNCREPSDFFFMLMDDEVLVFLMNEINSYAEQRIAMNTPLRRRSLFRGWKDVTTDELKILFAVIFNMGIIGKPGIKDYWKTNSEEYIPWFGSTMTRERFEILFHSMLHISSADSVGSEKIKGFFDLSVRKFQSFYYPGQNVAVDESGVKFKGRTKYLQYNPKKPAKWHLKIFSLCCSNTGYLFNAFPYFGSITEYPDAGECLSMTEKVVVQLCSPLQGQHHVFVDRFYTSVRLVKYLQQRNIDLTGTLNVGRQQLPQALKSLNLEKFEARFWHHQSEDFVVCAWRDKKAKQFVALISSVYKNEVINRQRKNESIRIPLMIASYNESMGAVDRFDQFTGYYSIVSRKSYKWWKKVFFWLLEAFVVNSCILYNNSGRPKLTLLQFKRSLISKLSRRQVEHDDPHPSPHVGHRSAQVVNSRFKEGQHLVSQADYSRDCRVCSKRGERSRRETSYFCTGCEDAPHLHPRTCYIRYHTWENYKL